MNTPLEAVPAHAGAHQSATHCPNCHARAEGKFCAACGESTTVHPVSAGEFLHEFIGHYVALEGKLWSTLKLLMTRPGQLTVEYLRGRRLAYVNPLRLYLSLSLVVFALIKLFGIELPQVKFDEHSFGASYRHSTPGALNGAPKAVTLSINVELKEDIGDKPLNWTSDAIRLIGQVNAHWADNLKRFLSEPAPVKNALLNRGFLANLPYMLIAAMPLFALYLKVIYRGTGRYYGEHLVFALHANAFAFLLASVMIIVPGSVAWLGLVVYGGNYALLSAWDFLHLLPFAWLMAYLPIAMRRVYGGSRAATLWRWLLLISVHLLVIFSLVIVAEAIAILARS